MTASRRTHISAWSAALLLLLALAAPGASAQRTAGSLQVSPTEYYAGQGVTYTGSLGSVGRKQIWLEYHMNRPGDSWTRIEGSSTYTDSSGRFSLTHPARGMLNISLRVASQGTATPAVMSRASDQDVALTIGLADPGILGPLLGSDLQQDHIRYVGVVGVPFLVTVDTSPTGGPILAGREIALQKRITADRWQTVATGRVDTNGVASFTQVVTQPAEVVYRARLGDWTTGGSRMGWFPSFPTTVDVMYLADLLEAVVEEEPASEEVPVSIGSAPVKATTSSSRYGWGRALFDFDWEYGESLTQGPSRGSRLRGIWVDASTGSGRAALHNAGLMLQSKFGSVLPADAGSGDRGTVSATLRGNAQTYGRWEARIRPWAIERGGQDYRVRFELIPEDPAQRLCGARSITIADLTPRRPEVRFGVYSPNRSRAWRGTRGSLVVERVAHAYAVEVARDHISWFIDGQIVGTVRARAALPKVPMTIRISLVGDGEAEMNHTYSISDWIRAFGIEPGQHPKSGPRLTAGTHSLRC